MNLPSYITGTTQAKAYRILRVHVYDVLSHYDLTPTYWSMLGIIIQARDGVRSVEIAETLHVKAPLVTIMSQDLQKRGIIRSVPNQFDARAKLLVVTPQGKKFMKTIEDKLNKALGQLLHGLTGEEMKTYDKVLRTIIANDQELAK